MEMVLRPTPWWSLPPTFPSCVCVCVLDTIWPDPGCCSIQFELPFSDSIWPDSSRNAGHKRPPTLPCCGPTPRMDVGAGEVHDGSTCASHSSNSQPRYALLSSPLLPPSSQISILPKAIDQVYSCSVRRCCTIQISGWLVTLETQTGMSQGFH